MTQQHITIGGASGFWGDAALATPQLLASGELDYLVYDYLAEITLSIMARARAADSSKGYAVDFVSQVMAYNLKEIHRQGVKVIANAGGVNVRACADALRELCQSQGLALKIATVEGDDLMPQLDKFAEQAPREMFSGEAFPPLARIASANAYLGAFPIAAALSAGADIVITGRCVDSAVTLGACIHAFAWQRSELDKLAQGCLAGHIIECGTQATGGNFTDWEQLVSKLQDAGYPMATIAADGEFVIHKPEGSGGVVSAGTVAEQMLYEIGDPQAYILPDVICDFSEVSITQESEDRVRVSGAKGRAVPEDYKVSITWADGYRAGQVLTMFGRGAERKAQLLADNVFHRARQMLKLYGLEDFSETCCEMIGNEQHFGDLRRVENVREVDIKLAVKHPDARGVGVFLKEMVGMALTAPPGLTGFSGARPKPSPVVRLFSTLLPKNQLTISVQCDGSGISCDDALPEELPVSTAVPVLPPGAVSDADSVSVTLEKLAFGRSGDKGDKANIGVIARHSDFVPFIAEQLSAHRVAQVFAHFLPQNGSVQRFYLPGTQAFNFLLHDVLGGGGVASLRSDPQGKAYAQILLQEVIAIPAALAKKHGITLLKDENS
ncbi:MAG: terpene utilization protein AtuA [Gammaproteobacteria bacterium]|nr:MAG: terpene utilization protein AtuA [Gammaproteobacteria bacterium]